MGATPSKNAAKTIILGANGCVGNATLESLLLRSQGEVDVYAGVRDEKKFEKHMLKVPTVKVDYGDTAGMTKSLKGFDRVFVIVPSDKNRTVFATNVLKAAKTAGVKFILMLSITIADTYSTFGRQFKPIEDATKSSGIPYTIIRLPLFMDNNFAHAQSVTKEGKIYDPKDPRRQFASVALEDVGKCAADILRKPYTHYNKTYKIVGQTYSMVDMSVSMSKVLGRQVKVKEITFTSFRESLLGNNIPEWQIDGLIEWLKLDFDVRITHDDLGTIETITGDKPTNLSHFVATNAHHFGWKLK